MMTCSPRRPAHFCAEISSNSSSKAGLGHNYTHLPKPFFSRTQIPSPHTSYSPNALEILFQNEGGISVSGVLPLPRCPPRFGKGDTWYCGPGLQTVDSIPLASEPTLHTLVFLKHTLSALRCSNAGFLLEV